MNTILMLSSGATHLQMMIHYASGRHASEDVANGMMNVHDTLCSASEEQQTVEAQIGFYEKCTQLVLHFTR